MNAESIAIIIADYLNHRDDVASAVAFGKGEAAQIDVKTQGDVLYKITVSHP